jgi:hypothetical protein
VHALGVRFVDVSTTPLSAESCQEVWIALTAIAAGFERHCGISPLTRAAPKKRRKFLQVSELVHAVAVRANIRSILVAMMKSFSCSPLIFFVCRETVALPQPKLIFG